MIRPVTTNVACRDHIEHDVTAWTTPVTGIVTTPPLPCETHNTDWGVVHQRSGLVICYAPDPETGQHMASLLADVADWTRPAVELLAEPGTTAAIERAIQRPLTAAESASHPDHAQHRARIER